MPGAQVAGLLLHREGLSRIGVGAGAAPLAERYAPVAGRIELAGETARLRSVYAAATAAFLVAQVTLHADGDRDFARAHRRELSVALASNLFPAALLFGLTVPGEGRVALGLAAPLLLGVMAAYTGLSLPAERRTARRALELLDRHGLSGDKGERAALRACLVARAGLRLARPLTRCFWVNWVL